MISGDKVKTLCRPFWNEVAEKEPVARLWRRDHTLWKPDPQEISNRLGWLDLPVSMRGAAAELAAFAAKAGAKGFRDLVLLGMGGSSLSAEVLRLAFPRTEGFLNLHVLDSTVPAAVDRVTRRIDPAHTLFLVSSKSGGTVEVMSLYRYFKDKVQKATGGNPGANFVAITDGGTSLQKLAADEKFRRTFTNPSDIGGRYSVLSYFGLVPAALIGVDVAQFLAGAREAARLCGVETPIEDNPGALLGMAAGCMARNGRDKLTIITSPRLAGFGLWAEQLVAESTGKEGRGIVPVVQEPFASPAAYGEDRLIVYLRLKDDDNDACDRFVRLLNDAGLPVLTSDLKDPYDLGGEFFKWEFATAIAGICLGINPFDQPNVEDSKKNTRRVLAECEKGQPIPQLGNEGDFASLLSSSRPGDYLALMVFMDDTPPLHAALTELRRRLLEKRRLPTTLGFGPRFLHSTGQLHKGGADNGLFVQITCNPVPDLPIPGMPYGFGTLVSAQALGDFESLRAKNRRCVRLHVANVDEAIRMLIAFAKSF